MNQSEPEYWPCEEEPEEVEAVEPEPAPRWTRPSVLDKLESQLIRELMDSNSESTQKVYSEELDAIQELRARHKDYWTPKRIAIEERQERERRTIRESESGTPEPEESESGTPEPEGTPTGDSTNSTSSGTTRSRDLRLLRRKVV